MRERLLIILYLLIVFNCNNIYGQLINSSDRLWYVVGGWGKSPGGLETNNYGVEINGNNISILGVGYPSAAPKKNDIFIVYENGQHFNSRGQSGFSLTQTAGLNEGYYLQCANPPLNLYFTNLYEGEDDPPLVSVCNDQANSLDFTTVGISTPNDLLTANHDVLEGADITVIIKNPGINREGATIQLDYDESVLTPAAIFPGNKAHYPDLGNVFDFISGRVSLAFDKSTPYIYINFNVSSSIPDSKNNLVFTLYDGATSIAELFEQVRESHDPNYVEVLNIFEREPREYWAHMHVQCYNDSREAHVNDAQIALNLPNTVDPTTLEMTDWSYGLTNGGLTQVSMVNNSGRVYFNFSNVPDILNMQGPDYYYVDPSQVAWVEFIVKINSTDPREVANINLRPTRPMTFFDGTPYDITKFIDRCFGNLSSGTDLCERKIMGTYYMSQFTETLAIKDPANTNQQNQICCAEHCKQEKTHNQCNDRKCCKKKKGFWKRLFPWVIAGVMTVIAVAD